MVALAKVREEELSDPYRFGQSVRRGIAGGLRAASDIAKTTYPSSNIYGAAKTIRDDVVPFGRSLVGARPESPVVEPTQQISTIPEPPMGRTSQQLPVIGPESVVAPTLPTPEAPVQTGMRFSDVADTEAFERGGLREMLRSPAPNIAKTLMQDPETGEYTVRESISGGVGGPALKKPFVDPSRFATRTGWDRKGNPIYSTGASEMEVANTGIAEYNKALVSKYGARNLAWEAAEGGVPRDIAQAELYTARAGLREAETVALPTTTESLRGLRSAQAELATQQAETSKLIKLKVPSGEVNRYEEPTTKEIAIDRRGNIFDPAAGLRRKPTMASALEARAALPTTQQSIVDKHFTKLYPNSQAPPEEIMSFIADLEK